VSGGQPDGTAGRPRTRGRRPDPAREARRLREVPIWRQAAEGIAVVTAAGLVLTALSWLAALALSLVF
jgi:hypothetical protein